MSAEFVFTICGNLVLPGWLLLIFLPKWKWTLGLICTAIIPFVIGVVYLILLASQVRNFPDGAGFGSVASISAAFSNPYLLVGFTIWHLICLLAPGK